MTKGPHHRKARADPDAYRFDQVLKKLETTKQRKHKKSPHQNEAIIDNSDGSSFDSRNDGHYFSEFDDDDGGGRDEQRHGNDERRQFETRQLFVDRVSVNATTSVDSFIEKQRSVEWHRDLVRRPVDINEELPGAILKVSSGRLERSCVVSPILLRVRNTDLFYLPRRRRDAKRGKQSLTGIAFLRRCTRMMFW